MRRPGWRDIAPVDLAVGAVLSIVGIMSATGVVGQPNPHHGLPAAIAILLMTAPVIFARREPVLAGATLAVGAAVNWLVIGDMVRCGAALPAVFYVAFMVGSRCGRWRDVAAATALLIANIVCQAFSDPRLGGGVIVGVGAIVQMAPITVGFVIGGRLVRGRNEAIARLRVRTAELRAQRERNARLAVAADQARIAEDLDGFLHGRIARIASSAAAGRQSLGTEPDEAREAFVAIQDTGRETLTHMRGVVASLHDQAPTQPQPVLAQLDRLLSRSDAALQVLGDPRLLPPGVELSGYRIVEHLLVALENEPAGRIDVRLTFGPDALQMTVSGPVARSAGVRAAIAAAAERAATHGGTLRTRAAEGRRETVVLIPLAGGHA